MVLGIMQPYFLPYLGYWQLLNKVDKYVICDDLQFSKKGWIQRNRILLNKHDKMLSLTIKRDSDYLNINERFLSDDFERKKIKILNNIERAYRRAPFFEEIFPLFKEILNFQEKNLFLYIYNSVLTINKYLDIETEIIVSSSVDINHNLKRQDKVIEICKKLEATEYDNAIGGQKLYSYNDFKSEGIKLKFLKIGNVNYKQFDNDFVPDLSILDALMFNSKEEVKEMLNKYILVEK